MEMLHERMPPLFRSGLVRAGGAPGRFEGTSTALSDAAGWRGESPRIRNFHAIERLMAREGLGPSVPGPASGGVF